MKGSNLHYTLHIFQSEQTLPFQSMVNIHAIKFYYIADPFINSSPSRRTPGVVLLLVIQLEMKH